MLGQAISMVVPKVVGYKITGILNPIATSTDVVLTITKVSALYNMIKRYMKIAKYVQMIDIV